MKFLCALLLLVSVKGFAQYPFEKYASKKYDSVLFKTISVNGSTNVFVAKYKGYRIELLELRLKDSSNLLLYYKNKLIQKIKGDDFLSPYIQENQPLYISDINGDGLVDFKFASANIGASGLASYRIFMFYLFNRGKNKFSLISFGDFFDGSREGYGSPKEYQFQTGGKYEIIGQSLAHYKDHNYWLFDLYNYKNGRLVNVSKKYNYPIAVPYLFKETYKVTNKIPKKQLEQLSLKVPEFYNAN